MDADAGELAKTPVSGIIPALIIAVGGSWRPGERGGGGERQARAVRRVMPPRVSSGSFFRFRSADFSRPRRGGRLLSASGLERPQMEEGFDAAPDLEEPAVASKIRKPDDRPPKTMVRTGDSSATASEGKG